MTEPADRRVLFLPGATGDEQFWSGVGEALPARWEKRYLGWPGLGSQRADPSVRGFADLLALAERALSRPAAVVAQSMGGIIGIQFALRRPDLVTHLILAATSGGVDLKAFGAIDWRDEFLLNHPDTARWIVTEKPDLTDDLPRIQAPTLLLWGEADPISPPAVGRFLAQRIPTARLEIIPGGGHLFATQQPERVAPLIRDHLHPTSSARRPSPAT
jgi:poly(3-hydroxyoctanoate) depolymerase